VSKSLHGDPNWFELTLSL
jgi:hypothetical protein